MTRGLLTALAAVVGGIVIMYAVLLLVLPANTSLDSAWSYCLAAFLVGGFASGALTYRFIGRRRARKLADV